MINRVPSEPGKCKSGKNRKTRKQTVARKKDKTGPGKNKFCKIAH